MQKIRFFSAIILFFALFCTVYAGQTSAQEIDLACQSAILVGADTGQVLYSKNPDQELPVGSINKIMTLLLAMEQIEDSETTLESNVTVSRYAESMGGSQIYLPANISIKMKNLLKAVAIASANDATVAVAEAIAGDELGFVEQMNKKAKELKMDNTQFTNSTGLPSDQEQYTTSRDIVTMSRNLIEEQPEVLKWTNTWVDYLKLPEREAMLVNTNKLVNDYSGMDGIKTGFTEKAGYCLAATAKRRDMRLISVVLKADSKEKRQSSTTKLLDYGFNLYNKLLMVKKGEKTDNIKIPLSKKEYITGEAAENLYILKNKLADKKDYIKKLNLKEDLQPPLEKGAVIGHWVVKKGDQKLGEAEIITSEKIEKIGFLARFWRGFVNLIGSIIS